MKLYKMKALMYRDAHIMFNSKYRLVEIFYFPITTIIIWGLFALYTRTFSAEAGLVVLIVNIFWSFALLAQSMTNMSINEDVWSGSLKQDLLSGISEFEYIGGRIISSSLTSVAVLLILFGIGMAFGIAPVIANTGAILFLSVVALVAAIALAVMVAGLYIYLGKEYGFLAWTFLQIFIVLSAPFFPISVYPDFIQPVVNVMPFTHVFEGTRQLVAGGTLDSYNILMSVILAFIYLAVSLPFYYYSFRRGKKTGSLVRME